MSPTFLELTVAVLLVVLAWRIGVWLAPHIFGSGPSQREHNTFKRPAHWPPEKNITPPAGQSGNPKNSRADTPK